MMNFREISRGFRANARLGWDLEGNWAPAWLYVIFALIQPIFGVAMLVVMYRIVMGGSGDQSYLAFLLAGAAAFLFVRLMLAGAGMVVVEDREHYKTFRYIYSSPVPFPAQILGRVTPKLGISLVGTILTFLAGGWFLKVPFRPEGIDWGTATGSLILALIGMSAIGWILASFMLIIDRMGWVLAEGVSGLLFMLTGAIFPLSLLPKPISAISAAMPITYWIDLWRLSIYGSVSRLADPGMALADRWIGLATTSLLWLAVAILWHWIADSLAKRWGKIEQETFY
jgi:ABC-2 type transport system permease protein